MRKQYSERSKEKTRATLELQARSDKLDHVSAQLEVRVIDLQSLVSRCRGSDILTKGGDRRREESKFLHHLLHWSPPTVLRDNCNIAPRVLKISTV